MHNKISNNVGFYLLLLFALTVTVYPAASYVIAAAVALIWIFDVLIFRDVELIELPLFLPVIAFAIFSVIALAVAVVLGRTFVLAYVGPLMSFSLIVPGFIMSGEKRKMIVWSLIAGVMLAAGFDLISWWNNTSGSAGPVYRPGQPVSFMVGLVFCILIAFYAEAQSLREKLFLGFITLPLAGAAALSFDRSIALVVAFVVVVIGVFKDRTALIPLAVAFVILFSGALGINYYIERDFSLRDYGTFVASPADVLDQDREVTDQAAFYGVGTAPVREGQSTGQDKAFFFNLVEDSGPPSLILFLWIVVVQAIQSLARTRKTILPEVKTFHLGILLVLGAVVIMNLYGMAFHFPSTILATALLLGMTEA